MEWQAARTRSLQNPPHTKSALAYSIVRFLTPPLNTNHWPNVEWDSVLERASSLYEAVFRPGDVGFIVSGHDFEFELKSLRAGKLPKFRNSVFSLSRKQSLGLYGVAGRQRITTYQDRYTRIISTYR